MECDAMHFKVVKADPTEILDVRPGAGGRRSAALEDRREIDFHGKSMKTHGFSCFPRFPYY